MSVKTHKTNIMIQLPEEVYTELLSLQTTTLCDPAAIIAHLVKTAHAQRAWLADLSRLREQIRLHGGLQVGSNADEVVERLRQTRREIFDSDYAHLY